MARQAHGPRRRGQRRADGALPRRQEIAEHELLDAFKDLVVNGQLFPVACGSATKNIGARGLLDLIVDGLPSPARALKIHAHDKTHEDMELTPEADGLAAYCFKTIADPHVGKISLLRVFSGAITADTPLFDERTHHREKVGQIFELQGKDHVAVKEIGPGDMGAVPKLKEVPHGRRPGGRRQGPRDRSDPAARAGRGRGGGAEDPG